MEIVDFGSLTRNFLWVFLRGGLEALGEQFPTQSKTIGNDDAEKVSEGVIMPLKLMLLRGVTYVSIVVGILCFMAVWEHFMNVVPTRMMVFGPEDSTKTPSRSESLDRKEKEEKDEPTTPLNANRVFGNWHWLPIYFFILFGWVQGGLVSLGTTYLPVGDFGRHLLLIAVTLLLCPIQFAATLASSHTASSQKTKESTPTEKKPSDDSREDSPPMKRPSKSAIAVLLLRVTVAIYSWLAPITLVWAISVELTKGGALKLSRYLSLTQYAIDSNLYYMLSASDLGIVSSKIAGVLALYVFIWVTLTLPATIVLRRVHASEWLETLERATRRETRATKQNLPSYPAALASFAGGPYRRLLAVYACGFVLLVLVAAVGMQLSMMAVAISYSASELYMGFWASLFLHLKLAVAKLC